jgi:hypothetical protein
MDTGIAEGGNDGAGAEGASTIGVCGAKKGIGGTFAVVTGAEQAAKGKGVAEGGSSKTEVQGSRIGIEETGLVRIL